MGRITFSRELCFFHAMSPVTVYVDGKKARKLSQEGEIQTYPIEAESVEVSVRELGFRSKPVTVKAGQTVLIKPYMPLVWGSYLLNILVFILLMYLGTLYVVPVELWGTWIYYVDRILPVLTGQLLVYLNRWMPIFRAELAVEPETTE